MNEGSSYLYFTLMEHKNTSSLYKAWEKIYLHVIRLYVHSSQNFFISRDHCMRARKIKNTLTKIRNFLRDHGRINSSGIPMPVFGDLCLVSKCVNCPNPQLCFC